jgi:hypothetical protein
VNKKPPKNLYYLFPGQGRMAHKRHIRNRIVAVIVGSLTAILLALAIYLIS